jgi:hypothetical protein
MNGGKIMTTEWIRVTEITCKKCGKKVNVNMELPKHLLTDNCFCLEHSKFSMEIELLK